MLKKRKRNERENFESNWEIATGRFKIKRSRKENTDGLLLTDWKI